MTPFLHGFGDELIKVSSALGVAKRVGRFAIKHPIITSAAAMTGVGSLMAAKGAYKTGLQGGEKPRYLAASVDRNGNAQASDVAYTNYHQLLDRKPSKKQVEALSKHYDESKFRR